MLDNKMGVSWLVWVTRRWSVPPILGWVVVVLFWDSVAKWFLILEGGLRSESNGFVGLRR